MYIFKHIKDDDNRFDIADITFEVETCNRDALIEEFIRFLDACGYNTKDMKDEIECDS